MTSRGLKKRPALLAIRRGYQMQMQALASAVPYRPPRMTRVITTGARFNTTTNRHCTRTLIQLEYTKEVMVKHAIALTEV